jgi:iron complex outermembrane receptor protein
VPLSSRTRATLGARQTRDERRIAGATAALSQDTAATLASARQEADWQKATWRVAVDHDVTPAAMVYVSWDRGFKSGLFNLLTYASAPVNPEVLDALQAGAKTVWFHNRLRLNLAAFNYQYRNIQVEEIVAGAVQSMNAAAAHLRGLELEAEYAPSRALSLRAGASLLHGRYTNFRNAPINKPTRDPAGTLLGGNTVVPGDASGLETVRSPKWTATVNGTYRVPTRIGEIGIAAGYYRNSGFAWDPDNRLRQGAYGVLNASIEWTSSDGRQRASLSGSNLTDEEVCLVASATALGDICTPRPPRVFGVEWTLSIGSL